MIARIPKSETRLQRAERKLAQIETMLDWFDSDDNEHGVPCETIREILES